MADPSLPSTGAAASRPRDLLTEEIPAAKRDELLSIAQKWNSLRSDLHALLGDRYEAKIAPLRADLRTVAEQTGGSLLALAILPARRAADEGRHVAMAAILSAALDEFEAQGKPRGGP